MIGKIPNKPCSHAQNNAWMNVENATEEEGMKVEKENNIPLTSFTDNKSVSMNYPTEQETTKHRVQEPLLHFDMLKNGMIGALTHAPHSHTSTPFCRITVSI